MKFKWLKFAAPGMIAFVLVSACNNEDGKNSPTTANEKTASESKNVPAETTKKTGKASTSRNAEADNAKVIKKDNMGYYSSTEVLPAYNGGQDALETYITKSIEYPQDAIDNNVEGTVNVQFAVDEKGNISNVKTVGTRIGHGLEEEAVRVVSAMPKWTPGQVKGKYVKTWRTLPITYRLES